MKEFQYPPYGELDRGYRESINPLALAPAAWRPAESLEEREATWLLWREETLSIISDKLWPLWNTESHYWINPNYEAMEALTVRDFSLFEVLLSEGILHQYPRTPVSSEAIPSHLDYFVDEDSDLLGLKYNFYDITLPVNQLASISNYKPVLDLKAGSGSVSLQFKSRLQRPRAYQIAKLIGRSHSYERSAKATTPSMSSGHCFQGCILICGIYENWLANGFTPTAGQLASLAQFAVDIGDRRVFAGVHFPSDNLASWIIALRLVREVCHDQRVTVFLSNAIQNHSHVYRLLNACNFDEYRPALAAIDILLTAARSSPG